MTRSKSHVTMHSKGYAGPMVPAVNVKVDYWRSPKFPYAEAEGMTQEYYEEYVEAHPWVFEAACESGWEMLQSDAEEIFGPGVKVSSEGRSGGWAIVDGLPDFKSWDAVMLGKWWQFERWARSTADAIPEEMVMLVYLNAWLPEAEREEEEALRPL